MHVVVIVYQDAFLSQGTSSHPGEELPHDKRVASQLGLPLVDDSYPLFLK